MSLIFQFRLLRADFILPLREQIDKFLGQHDTEQGAIGSGGRGIRLYSDVHVLRPVCSDRDLAYRLSFDVNRFRDVNWKTTQVSLHTKVDLGAISNGGT